MRELYVMIKPASGMCNMRCRYCFYVDEMKKRNLPNFGMMSEETLKKVLEHILADVTVNCTIAFQGGEPTLAGLDFFRKVVHYSRLYNKNKCRVTFALQTNGLLLDDEWCSFFSENHFLIGVSLDGIKEIHDKNRIDAAGKGTYNRIIKGIQCLKKHGVDTNILTVVTADTCRSFRKIYGFFERNQLEYQQYIPCLDPLGEERGNYPWSLTPENYEHYLKEAFDCWYQSFQSGQKKHHRYFDNLLLLMDGQRPENCGINGICGLQYVVEADGSVYPCDFYVLDSYKLGNLTTDFIASLDERRRKIGFIEQSLGGHEQCADCKWSMLCNGGCRRDRDYFEKGLGKNFYCRAYKGFFEYAYPRLEEICRGIIVGRF